MCFYYFNTLIKKTKNAITQINLHHCVEFFLSIGVPIRSIKSVNCAHANSFIQIHWVFFLQIYRKKHWNINQYEIWYNSASLNFNYFFNLDTTIGTFQKLNIFHALILVLMKTHTFSYFEKSLRQTEVKY